MWGEALTVIPRVDKERWQKLDIISKWLISTRAAVLIMTFLSAAIGGILAYMDRLKPGRNFDLHLLVICALGLVMAHAANNILNDIVDHFKGVDKGNYYRAQYGPQPLEHGLMSFRELFIYFFITGFIAFTAGVYLVYLTGWTTLWLFAAGSFFLLFYTWPLKYFGLGELAVVLVWGPLMIGGTYFVCSGVWSWQACMVSLPYALGVTTVLFGKHIDKLEQDKEKKVRTLPVIIGEKVSRYSVIMMMALQYAIAFYLVFRGYLALALTAFSLNMFVAVAGVYLKKKPETEPENYPKNTWPLYFVAYAFQHNKRFGLLFFGALLAQAFLIPLFRQLACR